MKWSAAAGEAVSPKGSVGEAFGLLMGQKARSASCLSCFPGSRVGRSAKCDAFQGAGRIGSKAGQPANRSCLLLPGEGAGCKAPTTLAEGVTFGH